MSTTQPIMVRGSLPAWRNAVFAVFALSGLGFASWVSRIPVVRDGMQLSTATIGLMLFGLAFGSIAGLATAPNYMARMGTRNGLRYSLLAMAAATVLLGLAAGVWGSFALSAGVLVLFGFAYSITDVVMNVEGADVEKANGRTLLPMMHAFFSLGTIIGAGLGALAAMNTVPVALHFTVVGLAIAAAGSWSVRHVPGPGTQAPGKTPTPPPVPAGIGRQPRFGARLRETLKMSAEPQLFFLGLMVIGMAFVEGSANDWLPLAAVDGHGFDNAGGALVYGTFVAAMTCGRAAGGPLIDRLGRRHTLTIMGALGLIGILVFILTDTQWTAFAAAALWGLGGSLGFPIGVSAAADHPTHSARRVSIISIFGYMAFLVGPPVLGVVGEHLGILNAFCLVALMLLLSLLVAPRAMRGSPR